MERTTAYRDGWLAHKCQIFAGDNPYDGLTQHASHLEWERGHRDRASKVPGDPYLEILDAEIMGS